MIIYDHMIWKIATRAQHDLVLLMWTLATRAWKLTGGKTVKELRAGARCPLDSPSLRPHAIARGTFDTGEKLGEAIDLIVVSSAGKLHELGPKFLEPAFPARQMNLTRHDAR